MAKVLSEKDIRKLHRTGQLDKKALKKPEPEKSEPPPKPLPEIETMNKVLNQLIEIFRTSKDISDRNDKVAEFLAKRVESLESKIERKEKPKNFDIVPERGKDGYAKKYSIRFI